MENKLNIKIQWVPASNGGELFQVVDVDRNIYVYSGGESAEGAVDAMLFHLRKHFGFETNFEVSDV